MSRKSSMYTPHLATRLTAAARVALPRLAARASVPYAPMSLTAPLVRSDFSALSNAARVEHVERWAMELIVERGPEQASARVLDLVAFVDERRGVAS